MATQSNFFAGAHDVYTLPALQWTIGFLDLNCSQQLRLHTSKSLSEALIFASTNPLSDDRLFIELRVQYMKIASPEHFVYKNFSFVVVFNLKALNKLFITSE